MEKQQLYNDEQQYSDEESFRITNKYLLKNLRGLEDEDSSNDAINRPNKNDNRNKIKVREWAGRQTLNSHTHSNRRL